MQTLETDWKLSSSASLNYVKAISDLLDFRKASGVTDHTLRCFTVTDVYLRRGKENLSKKKRLESTRNLDLETLIARNSWATIEEMEQVITYHIEKFKDCILKSKNGIVPNKNELVFCVRFITTYLFLRVKCSRPMTYQFLTVDMVNKAKTNGGFIDQKEFKTADNFVFDTLIIDREVLHILQLFIDHVRPLLRPSCDFLLISTNGTQFQSLTTAMTILVHEAIGKYIHPTRYRQIVETESSSRLSYEEQEVISEDQKHSSTVAKTFYKKKRSRDVALAGKRCMDKMTEECRAKNSDSVLKVLSEVQNIDQNFDESVLRKSHELLSVSNDTCSSSATPQYFINTNEETEELSITHTLPPPQASTTQVTLSSTEIEEISSDVTVKKEKIASTTINKVYKHNKFTKEEDMHLNEGIKKYGRKSWSMILKDKNFKFHASRTRDALRMRAEASAFKKMYPDIKYR